MLQRFIVLDLDRTLLDTEAYARLLISTLLPMEGHDKAAAKLAGVTGQSFDFLAYILDKAGVDYKTATAKVLQAVQPGDRRLLMPGAAEFIGFLVQSQEHFGILTMGTVPNQQLKLAVLHKITGVTISAEITNTQNKSLDFLQNRWDGNAFYLSPDLSGVGDGLRTKTIILVDDKQSNLTEAHQNIVAMHVPPGPLAEQHTLESVVRYIEHTARQDAA